MTASRRTQQERREETRQRLLDATIGCLVDHGYAGTTTQRVQARAGVSRGALLHHFASKAELLAAATHHVAEQQIKRIRGRAALLPEGEERAQAGLGMLRSLMSGPLFLAGLELWMAARTDAELRAALKPSEREVGRVLRDLGREVFGLEIANNSGFDTAYESLLILLRGMALTSVLRENEQVHEDVLQLWTERILTE